MDYRAVPSPGTSTDHRQAPQDSIVRCNAADFIDDVERAITGASDAYHNIEVLLCRLEIPRHRIIETQDRADHMAGVQSGREMLNREFEDLNWHTTDATIHYVHNFLDKLTQQVKTKACSMGPNDLLIVYYPDCDHTFHHDFGTPAYFRYMNPGYIVNFPHIAREATKDSQADVLFLWDCCGSDICACRHSIFSRVFLVVGIASYHISDERRYRGIYSLTRLLRILLPLAAVLRRLNGFDTFSVEDLSELYAHNLQLDLNPRQDVRERGFFVLDHNKGSYIYCSTYTRVQVVAYVQDGGMALLKRWNDEQLHREIVLIPARSHLIPALERWRFSIAMPVEVFSHMPPDTRYVGWNFLSKTGGIVPGSDEIRSHMAASVRSYIVAEESFDDEDLYTNEREHLFTAIFQHAREDVFAKPVIALDTAGMEEAMDDQGSGPPPSQCSYVPSETESSSSNATMRS